MNDKALQATIIGCISLIFWSFSATMAAFLQEIPAFEIITITFGLCFIISATKLTLTKQWHRVHHPLYIWLIGTIAIFGADITFVSAFKYAPAAQVDLINFLWPIFLILFVALLPNESISKKHIIATIIAFDGIYLLFSGDNSSYFSSQYLLGYGLALSSALLWSGYSVFSRYHLQVSVDMMGMYCGIGALISLVVSWYFKSFALPSISQSTLMIFMGSSSTYLAFTFWDYGVKHGYIKILALLSYFTPLMSYFMLVLSGMIDWQMRVFFAFVTVTFAAIIGSTNFKQLLKQLKKQGPNAEKNSHRASSI